MIYSASALFVLLATPARAEEAQAAEDDGRHNENPKRPRASAMHHKHRTLSETPDKG